MGTSLLCGLVIFLHISVPTDAGITQNSRYLIKATGHEVTLRCDQDLGHNSMYWYRQDPDLGLQLIAYSFEVNKVEIEVPHGYDGSRKGKSFFLLILKSPQRNQTSVYFCATSLTTAGQSHRFLAQKGHQKKYDDLASTGATLKKGRKILSQAQV